MRRWITHIIVLSLMMVLFMPAFAAADIPEVAWNPDDAHIAPADSAYREYALPFLFAFQGRTIDRICVYTDGLVELLEASGEPCTYTNAADAAGRHASGVPVGMDAIFVANDDLTTGVVINGFADKVIISFTGSTTVDNNFFDDTIQMQVILYSDGGIRWNFYAMYYVSHDYDLFSGIHVAGGTELPLPILDTTPPDGITDYWPGYDLYDTYEFDGTDIVRITADLYEDYVFMFDDAYLEFDLITPFSFFGRAITGIAVNTNGLIELLEADESAQDFIDDETVDEFGDCIPGADGIPDDWSCFGFDLYVGPPGTHFLGIHALRNIDALFLANDDLITGAMINGDADRTVITLSGITYDGNREEFVAKPLQMQVILLANGGILWNFFSIQYTNNTYDLYSGLYDEVGNLEIPLAGGTPLPPLPPAVDVMRSYEFAPCIQDDATCDGIDDDCDGQIDEDYVSQPTTCGVGECSSTGQTVCVDGVEGDTCTPGQPSAEVCDGLDNNCDGEVDEGCTGGTPGDCNSDTLVDAGDLTALVLEIFDDDGNLPADAPGSTFPGDPVGCDANEDGIIDAGDLTCTVLMIFNGPGACGGGAASVSAASGEPLYRAALAGPELTIPFEIPAHTGGTVTKPVSFAADGTLISSTAIQFILREAS